MASSPLRRLTRTEYDNAVRDLLGDTTGPATRFAPESRQLGFTNGAASSPLSVTVVEDFETAALSLAARAATSLSTLLPCDPASAGEDACAERFIRTFGRRTFRQTVVDATFTTYRGFYATQKTAFGFPKAIEMRVAAMLQSPAFLYRVRSACRRPATPKRCGSPRSKPPPDSRACCGRPARRRSSRCRRSWPAGHTGTGARAPSRCSRTNVARARSRISTCSGGA